MTPRATPGAAARLTSRARPRTAPWRGLAWIGWRQHRFALLSIAALLVLAAVTMAITGPALHRLTDGLQFLAFAETPRPKLNDAMLLVEGLLITAPVLAGMFLGAPLIAADAEHRTTQVVWTQAVSRERWFIAQVVPLAAGLALAGAGLGLELRWWLPSLSRSGQLVTWMFAVNPLPLAAWMVIGLSLGIGTGAAIRRVVPAMAATAGGYAILYLVMTRLRPYYLPPLHKVVLRQATAHGYGFFYGGLGRGSDLLNSTLSFPGGRPISNADEARRASWFVAHHIQLWITYQPGSRYGLFELIEFGLLIAVSAILIGAAIAMIRRRPA